MATAQRVVYLLQRTSGMITSSSISPSSLGEWKTPGGGETGRRKGVDQNGRETQKGGSKVKSEAAFASPGSFEGAFATLRAAEAPCI